MDNFKKIFKKNYEIKASSYARINLIGEHTDYTGGYVLPTLINYKTEVYLSYTNQKHTVHSTLFNETVSFNNLVKSKNYH